MNTRRLIPVLATLSALLALGSTSWAAGPRQLRPDGQTPVVVRGIVAESVLPYGVRLADGTVLTLAPGPAGDLPGEPAELRPGDEIVAIGAADQTGMVTVRGGSLRLVRSGGRVSPVSEPACGSPAAGAGRTAAASVRTTGIAEDDETEIEGVVGSVGAGSLTVVTEHEGEILVLVTAETEFREFDDLSDLETGDKVKARGELNGTTLTASRLELEEKAGGGGGGGGGGGSGSGSGVEFESTGLITGLAPPDSFSLDDGLVYRVDLATVYDTPLTGYGDLAAGQFVKTKAGYAGPGEYVVTKIELEGDEDSGQGYREVEGTVRAVDAAGLALETGLAVLFTPTTVFNGDADSWADIRPGWSAHVVALLNRAGNLLAIVVRAEDPAPATTSGQEFEPHEALLVLAAGADPAAVAGRHGAEVVGTAGSLGVLMKWSEEIDDTLLAQLAADPDVVAVEPNYLFRDPESSRKRFPVVDRSVNQEKYRGQVAVTQIRLAQALTAGTGAGTVVAVVDTGVEPCHPLLQGHIIAGGLDTVDGDLQPWETRDGLDQDGDGDVDEAAGHGTFVASLVALAAPGARILPYRVLDDDGGGTAFDLAVALADAIDRNVDVINLSLTYHARSTVVDLLLEEAAARGIVVVASAGNDGAAVLAFPASDSHVLAVTALAADGTALASFANRSPRAAVAAPGEELYGALDGGRYGTWSGTSMAAPLAAAGAALLKGRDRTVDPAIVRQALLQGGSALTDGPWTGVGLDLAGTLALLAP